MSHQWISDAPTELLDFAAAQEQRSRGRTKHPWRWMSVTGICLTVSLVSGFTLASFFVYDGLAPGLMTPRWSYIVGACVGVAGQVSLVAVLRDAQRRVKRFTRCTEDRLLRGQAEVRSQIALMRAEMNALLGPLPGKITEYGDERATEAWLAGAAHAATGTDGAVLRATVPAPATVTYLYPTRTGDA